MHAPLERATRPYEVMMGGFGGQGVLMMGQILAGAALLEGREVIWTPAYGPEMRGGPAFCTVIISAVPIGAPVVAQADAALIMDQTSVGKYVHRVRPGGVVLYNASLVRRVPALPDRRCVGIQANHLAEELGAARTANMVMLGAFLTLAPLAQPQSVLDTLRDILPERRRNLLPLNERALEAGKQAVEAFCKECTCEREQTFI